MTNLELARRALYLARLARAETYVGQQARRLMRGIGAELDARGVTAADVLALFRAAKNTEAVASY